MTDETHPIFEFKALDPCFVPLNTKTMQDVLAEGYTELDLRVFIDKRHASPLLLVPPEQYYLVLPAMLGVSKDVVTFSNVSVTFDYNEKYTLICTRVTVKNSDSQ
jgi:hypothetical protein